MHLGKLQTPNPNPQVGNQKSESPSMAESGHGCPSYGSRSWRVLAVHLSVSCFRIFVASLRPSHLCNLRNLWMMLRETPARESAGYQTDFTSPDPAIWRSQVRTLTTSPPSSCRRMAVAQMMASWISNSTGSKASTGSVRGLVTGTSRRSAWTLDYGPWTVDSGP
jgi:hypothetical protein